MNRHTYVAFKSLIYSEIKYNLLNNSCDVSSILHDIRRELGDINNRQWSGGTDTQILNILEDLLICCNLPYSIVFTDGRYLLVKD